MEIPIELDLIPLFFLVSENVHHPQRNSSSCGGSNWILLELHNRENVKNDENDDDDEMTKMDRSQNARKCW